MNLLRRHASAVTIAALSLLLSGCSMLDFLEKKKDTDPDKLSGVDEEVDVRRNWSMNIGNGAGDNYRMLKPALAGPNIYAASNNGLVVAVTTETGKRLWRQDLDIDLSGGVGVGGGLVLVGTENAEIYALKADTGEQVWKATVSSEVLSAPAANARVVVVQSIDGRVTGLDAKDGHELWTYDNPVPALSLRGTSSPLIVDNFALSAQAGGTVQSLAIDNGTLRWEERVAIPTGKSDIDRLVDIDGELMTNDGMLIVPSYQGYLSLIEVVTGQTRWRVKESSVGGAGFGFGNVYVVSDDDTVKAYKVGQDEPVWKNESLNYRQLSAPLGFSNYVAVGDFEGYVHLLAQSDGRFVGRVKVDGAGVRSQMLAQGNTFYVYGNSGDLVSYTVQ